MPMNILIEQFFTISIHFVLSNILGLFLQNTMLNVTFWLRGLYI